MKIQLLSWRVKCVGAAVSVVAVAGALAFPFSYKLSAEDADRSESPYMQLRSGEIESFPLSSTDVRVSLSGSIAHVKVEQKYKNSGSTPIEAVYVFPASTRAAVHRMAMTVGTRTTEAKVKERDEARAEYERAKQNGITAALLEQEKPNVFTANVGNILPGDSVSVTLEFTERVMATDGIYEYVYPTVVGPRYSNGSQTVSRWVSNPYLGSAAPEISPATFHLAAELQSPLTISKANSPSHQVAATFKSAKEASIELSDASAGNRDFVLEYVLGDGKIENGISLHRGDKENFFLLQIEPPKRVTLDTIVPRELIFVVDVSGSMEGFPLSVSKKLMESLLTDLRAVDSFNIVLFAGSSSRMNPSSLQATTENIARARQFLSQQNAGGGTELMSALRDSMSIPRAEGVSRSFAILTDGFVTVEDNAMTMIRDNLGDANFFPFGIGTSVNRYLIESIAKAGRTEPFVVLSESEAGAKAKRFQEMVQSPVMTDIEVSFEGMNAYDIEPAKVPDLLSERPIAIVGKFNGEPKGSVVLTGKTAAGPYRSTIEIADSASAAQSNPALPYLWARERISRLSDFAGLEFDNSKKSEVIALGLRYNLLTQFTSFVAIDSAGKRTAEQVTTVQQPLPLPHGVSAGAAQNVWSPPVSRARSSYQSGGYNGKDGRITYNDGKITNSVNAVLLYVEGSFGAIVMVVCGIGAIFLFILACSTKSRSLRYSSYLLVVIAVGAFALRSVMSTFFNDRGL